MKDVCPHCHRPMSEPPPPKFTWERWVEVFWSRVKRGAPDECWPWLNGTTDDGYGAILVPRPFRARIGAPQAGVTPAHRVAWSLTNGPLPRRSVVRHRCNKNRLCCNPSHLLIGTHNDNGNDEAVKNRAELDRLLDGVTP